MLSHQLPSFKYKLLNIHKRSAVNTCNNVCHQHSNLYKKCLKTYFGKSALIKHTLRCRIIVIILEQKMGFCFWQRAAPAISWSINAILIFDRPYWGCAPLRLRLDWVLVTEDVVEPHVLWQGASPPMEYIRPPWGRYTPPQSIPAPKD